jgi:serine O-acetyltransferase
MFRIIAQDLGRCGENTAERLREILLNPGMWAVVGYRYRRWVYTARLPRPIRRLLNISSTILELWLKIATHIELPATAEIGPGLYIPHTGYIIVSSRTRIGSYCTLTQGVTIGHRGGGTKAVGASPIIGDRVYVGPSAAITGPITIGDDALIGVGAIVIGSVPPGGVAVGNPARVTSCRGSFDLIAYPGMNADPKRAATLALLRPPPEPATERASHGLASLIV